jgi:hypothetical protein
MRGIAMGDDLQSIYTGWPSIGCRAFLIIERRALGLARRIIHNVKDFEALFPCNMQPRG